MKKIGIIGAGDIEILTIAKKVLEANMDIVIVDVKTIAQAKELNILPFEPIIIDHFTNLLEKPKFYKFEPSKFISKPKHNYKRR